MSAIPPAVPPRAKGDSGPPLAFATDDDLIQELGRRYSNVLCICLTDTPPNRPGEPKLTQALVLRHAGDPTRTLGMFVRAGRYINRVLMPTEAATFSNQDDAPPNGEG